MLEPTQLLVDAVSFEISKALLEGRMVDLKTLDLRELGMFVASDALFLMFVESRVNQLLSQVDMMVLPLEAATKFIGLAATFYAVKMLWGYKPSVKDVLISSAGVTLGDELYQKFVQKF